MCSNENNVQKIETEKIRKQHAIYVLTSQILR